MVAQIIPLRRIPAAGVSAGVALPTIVPLVAWDPRRGVFILSPDDPRWTQVRAAYERLAIERRPIVSWGAPAWRSAPRRMFAALRRARGRA
ncbi:MAG: hypothetical protein AB1760_10170 [Pseudomonadota bacterium]